MISLGLVFVSCAPVCAYVYTYIYNFFFFLSWNRKPLLLAPFPGGESKAAREWAAWWRVWLPGKPCPLRSRVLLLVLCVLGRPPAQIIEIPCDTLSEPYVVTVPSLPSLLFIGEALPKTVFCLPKAHGLFAAAPQLLFFPLNILMNGKPSEEPVL